MSVWLALETATPHAVVAVVQDGEALASRRLLETRRHAEALADAIDETLGDVGLSLSALEGVAVGVGPGSFVGVRVAMAHAKGLCSALARPLLGFCSLTAMAAGESADAVGWAMLDARRGEIFARAVTRTDGRAVPTDDVLVLSPTEAMTRVDGAGFVVGNVGALLPELPAHLIEREGPTSEGLARTVAGLLAVAWEDQRTRLLPAYGRSPDAKLPGGVSLPSPQGNG